MWVGFACWSALWCMMWWWSKLNTADIWKWWRVKDGKELMEYDIHGRAFFSALPAVLWDCWVFVLFANCRDNLTPLCKHADVGTKHTASIPLYSKQLQCYFKCKTYSVTDWIDFKYPSIITFPMVVLIPADSFVSLHKSKSVSTVIWVPSHFQRASKINIP